LAPSTINLRLAAVRRLAYEAADTGLLSPDLAAGIRRVKGAKKVGIRLGNWLTVDQAKALLRAPDIETVRGKRDRAMLAVCLVADCAGPNSSTCTQNIFRSGKITGPLLT
jgi:site-specific recombinase XerD